MEKESFRDPKIAKLLNQNYMSLKVDREVSPHIDSYMTMALARVKGTAGWPITAVLTPDSEIIFIDAYIKRNELFNLLSNLAETWKTTPEWVRKQSALYEKIVRSDTVSNNSVKVNKIDWSPWLANLKSNLDQEYGGLRGAPNFPEASLVLLLIDWAQRLEDIELDELLHNHLRNMINKGLYDSVNGGFHRYTSDNQWRIPHYEKMLYTQALMLEVYSRAYRVKPDPAYKVIVRETLVFLNQYLAKKNGLFMSSVDAVHNGVEGGYYLYSEEEIAAVDNVFKDSKSTRTYEKDGLFGVYVDRPIDESFNQIRAHLLKLRNKKQLNIDSKLLVSWNALLISGLKEAYLSFGEPIYKTTAIKIGDALLSEHSRSEVLPRIINPDDKSISATLEDYAFLLRASLDLYDITSELKWLKYARDLMNESINFLWNDKDTFKFSNAPGSQQQFLSLHDGELINPKSAMLENIYRLNMHVNSALYVEQFEALMVELTSQTVEQPMQQLFSAKVLYDIENGNTESIQYIADGNGKVELKIQPDQSHLLIFKFQHGWHVNSHQPLDKELIATNVEFPIPNNVEVIYPAPLVKEFTGTKTKVSVFDKHFSLHISNGQGIGYVDLQACSTELNLCLQPEKLIFNFGQ
ncbi:hypothetical protein MACH26_31180 [Planctobacterium marinum]|uniref:Spermatogenesis-associated protein 20-like TRX domain-containing protein n=2 Tax=Planctobacterium marinum TaxID=1631968 RepID=A0AA48HQ34_9ALTE|nr:hypothetical protein MACH26_31180 [Planctobacterium marinum]